MKICITMQRPPQKMRNHFAAGVAFLALAYRRVEVMRTMKRSLPLAKFGFAVLSLSVLLSGITLGNELYFQKGARIIRWSEKSRKTVVVWTAPFQISDVSVSRDGHVICFTRSTGKKANDPSRAVGVYSVADRQFSMINSGARYNYGAVISPNDSMVAFNYLPGHDGWKAAIYDMNSRALRLNVAPENVFGWRTDSLLLFARWDGVAQRNVFDSSLQIFHLPDSNAMGMSYPGTTLSFVSDSLYFFKCEDETVSIKSLDGPPQNIFIVREGKASRLIEGKVDVRSSVLAGNFLYVDLLDYTASKKGKAKLLRYSLIENKCEALSPLGLLVGAFVE